MPEQFPLEWPEGWARSPVTSRARFITTHDRAIKNLFVELKRFGATNVVVSSNQPVKSDGTPYANRGVMGDAGVAIYFTYEERQVCIPCDRWDRLQDNIHAIALTINAMRGMERWGAKHIIDKAFLAFEALPAPDDVAGERTPARASWWEVLGVARTCARADIRAARIRLAKRYHPDSGSEPNHDMMSVVNVAADEGMKERPR